MIKSDLKKCLIIVFIIISYNHLYAQTWTQIPSGTSKDLTSISFPSNLVGYIGGEDSLLLKTTDGGQNWLPLNYSGITFYPNGDDIIDLKFVSETVGFLTVGPYSGTYKTVDGGITWSLFDAIYACYNHGLYFFDESNGFLGGSGCFSGEIINKLSNGTWAETNINPLFVQSNGIINNFDFWNDSLGLATSTSHYFFRTTNGGTTWDTIPNTLISTDSLTSVLFVDSLKVIATFLHGQNGGFGVLISDDAGLTWQQDINSATFYYPSMYASEKTDQGNIFIGGQVQITTGGINPGMIYRSDEQMVFWAVDNVAESIRDLASHSDSAVFAVGENGYIIVNQNLANLGIKNLEHDFEIDIYPNPNNGEFSIKIGDFDIQTIEIYNVQGQLIHSLDSKSIKNNPITFSHLDSGIYSVHLKLNHESIVRQVVVN